ncbi:MAG: tripartite tricarboxylate transporter TctB family protein [Hyphomicrobiaceae bacterium]
MKRSALWGELALSLIFIGAALFWVLVALGLPMWEGFAPSSGFMPLIYGILMAAFAIAAIAVEVLGAGESGEPLPPVGRPVMVLLALAAGVAGIEVAGFAVSMFLAMLFLFRVAERRPILKSLAASAVTAAVLTLVFRIWLGVPLPSGPWGF